jgi:hypothetical protein
MSTRQHCIHSTTLHFKYTNQYTEFDKKPPNKINDQRSLSISQFHVNSVVGLLQQSRLNVSDQDRIGITCRQ